MVLIIAFSFLAYFVGAIPVAYLLGRCWRHQDIRLLGSGNVGAVNAFRQFGWPIGTAVFVADLSKGAAVILTGRALGLPEWGILVGALAATVGHNWSPYIGFRGGKGVAPVFGMSLAMVPALSLLALPLMLACFIVTRSVVWAFGLGFIELNALVAFTAQSATTVAMCLLLSALVVATHFYRSLPEIRAALRARNFKALGVIE
jgi:glycerol-3-phosphate acyltransferase PlsY